jgi:hypothetical protein
VNKGWLVLPQSSFRKLRNLSPEELWLLTQALVLLPLTLCGIRAFGVSRWHRTLLRFALCPGVPVNKKKDDLTGSVDEILIQRAQVIARMVKIAAYYGIVRAHCLPQALVLSFLLRRRQIASAVRFGARKEGGKMEAHAWVDCFGVALNEDENLSQRFSTFEFPAHTLPNEF